ncbi:disulfide bond formation protein [Rathayibacter toxicus]|nr:disulfide bond formation protein [Rathayibacter toxicus]QWL31515.1 disulfide bond formation protein [Rathayibacter toxicus]QWL33607.1 disulfide bond formation protein [Rathayibacter toxicus]QWL35742.1 disulfide bond formation protein [Rathayibacter toxicus]QWL37831.1 disulfide bond formation protein [Rathayibacter toxicus]
MSSSRSPLAMAQATLRRFRVIVVILVAVTLFLGVVALGQGTSGGGAAEPQASPSTVTKPVLERRDPQDPAAVGPVDAPLVLIEWADLRCPFCAQFGRETLPTIEREYIDSGKIRTEMHDVAFFGEQSEQASVAARAAGRQGKYPDYLRTVFAAAPPSGHPDLPREKLVAFARAAGVPDLARFEADLTDPELLAAVKTDTLAAHNLGVNSVPFFVAGGTAVSGAPPVDRFRAYLDAALAKK